eukprot:5821602-Alexandrium_andersonii.AAC.1
MGFADEYPGNAHHDFPKGGDIGVRWLVPRTNVIRERRHNNGHTNATLGGNVMNAGIKKLLDVAKTPKGFGSSRAGFASIRG